jgi:hypothetical protein
MDKVWKVLIEFLKSKELGKLCKAFTERPIRMAVSCSLVTLVCAVSWSLVMPRTEARPPQRFVFKCTNHGCEGELTGAAGSVKAE